MSILADLLSKKNRDESRAGKDVPPTLARAQEASAKKRSPPKRYIVIAVVSMAFIAAGLLIPSIMGRLMPYKVVKHPLPPQATAPATPSQATVAPPPQPPLQQTLSTASAAKTTFETKPYRQDDNKRPAKHAVARRKHTRPPQASGPTNAQQLAALELQLLAAKRPDTGLTNRIAASTPAKPDMAAKGAFLYAARSAEQAGDWRSALANYRSALEIDPENYKIMSNEAASLNNLGMFEEGARAARRALDRKPGYVPAMINAAIAYSSQGNSLEALRLFSAASSADPGNRILAVNLGILQERMGKLDEALATYRRLAAVDDPHALMGMGRIRERKGDIAGATDSYRRILALRDAPPAAKKEARDNLARLEE